MPPWEVCLHEHLVGHSGVLPCGPRRRRGLCKHHLNPLQLSRLLEFCETPEYPKTGNCWCAALRIIVLKIVACGLATASFFVQAQL